MLKKCTNMLQKWQGWWHPLPLRAKQYIWMITLWCLGFLTVLFISMGVKLLMLL